MTDKPALLQEVADLEKKLDSVSLPPELKEKTQGMIERLLRMARYGEYSTEYEKTSHYIDWVTSLPWDKRSQDILDLENAKKILDKNHYDLVQIKERILEYIAVLNLNFKKSESRLRAPILCFVGLVGTGKTTIASSIAEAMGRKFARIPFGGLGDPLDLRGQSRLRADAEPGLIVKALRRAGTKNPVILLDEIDRVADESRSSIMGVLVELLDPEQNNSFQDHFLDYPFDLSEVLFIATCNNTTNISVAVMDRLEPLQMPSYSDEEKITIGRDYILPRALEESGLDRQTIQINPDAWSKIVRPLGYDSGIRTLERTIYSLCRKVAKIVLQGKERNFNLNADNIKDFLPNW